MRVLVLATSSLLESDTELLKHRRNDHLGVRSAENRSKYQFINFKPRGRKKSTFRTKKNFDVSVLTK